MLLNVGKLRAHINKTMNFSVSSDKVTIRSVCLARGRSYTVPTTTLLDNCDHWHISDIADPRDGPMTSMAVLRRDLVSAL